MTLLKLISTILKSKLLTVRLLKSQLLVFALLIPVSGYLLADESKPEHGEFFGAMDTVYPDWFKVSFMELEEDVAEAAEQGKRLMLLFHQDGCPYCNAFVEKNLAQKDIEDTLRTKFDVIEFNMWGDREVVSVAGEVYSEKEFAKALSVQFTPSILFLTEEGQLSLRLNGYYDPDQFRQALDYVTNKMEGKQSFSDFLEKADQTVSSKTLTQPDYLTGPITELSLRAGIGEKPLLIMFEQGTCENCETLHNSILSKAESRKLLEQYDVFQVDMWGRDPFTTLDGSTKTGREWSKELGVNYAPTMILYAADGTEVIRTEAFFKVFHVQSILDYVQSDEWRTQPSFQRYISARAEIIRESGTDVNIWETK